MSGLLIRADKAAGVLRSLGDRPNGVVALASPDGLAAWAIDSNYEPPVKPQGGGLMVDPRPATDGVGDSTVVATADVVAGCEGHDERVRLLQLALFSISWAYHTYVPSLTLETVASHVQLAIDTRDALDALGFFEASA